MLDADDVLRDLVDVVDRLRSPGGSPWYAAQTHASLLRYVLEEAHEVAEAVHEGDATGGWDALREELGDLLLQVVLHARLAAEHEEPFGLAEVAAGVADKMRRRHPHVFAEPAEGTGPSPVRTAADEEAGWEALKAGEKERSSALDGIPVALPSLQRAQQVLERAERAGLVAAAAPGGARQPALGTAGEVGRHLLDVVRAARSAGVDAEAALRAALRAEEAALRAEEASEGPAGRR